MKKSSILLLLVFATFQVQAQDKFYELLDQVGHQVKLGDKVIFYVSNTSRGAADFIYSTDGTNEGTQVIGSMEQVKFPSSYLSYPSNGNLNGEHYFSARETQDGDYGVWKTDGTPEGTVKVTEVDEATDAEPRYFAPLDGKIYFIANSSFGEEFLNTTALFSIDSQGNLASYPLITNPGTQFENYRQIFDYEIHNGQIYAQAIGTTNSLYRVDTNTGQYTSVAGFGRIDYMQSTALGLMIVGSPTDNAERNDVRLYMMTNQEQILELSNSDPDFSEFGNTLSNEAYFISEGGKIFHESDGRVYYLADDANDNNALWSTDGTPSGTVMHYVAEDLSSQFMENLFTTGGQVYFSMELDLSEDGFADGEYLMNHNPTTGQTQPVIKDDKYVIIGQADRVNTIYYDLGFLRAEEYIFFPASLVKEEYYTTGDSLFSDLILALDGSTGGVDVVLSSDAGIQDTGILNIVGNNLLLTGWDDQSASIFEDDFFTLDISEFEVTSSGGGNGPGGGGSTDNLVEFYEERFSSPLIRDLPLLWSYEIDSTTTNSWVVSSKSQVISNANQIPDFQWLDNSGLSSVRVSEEPYSSAVLSPKISIQDYEDLELGIDYYYYPEGLLFSSATISIEARTDNNPWVEIESVSGAQISSYIYEEFTTNLNTIQSGDSLQLKFTTDFGVPEFGIGVGGVLNILIDDVRLSGTPLSDTPTEPNYATNDILLEDFNEAEFNDWSLVQSQLSSELALVSWYNDSLDIGFETSYDVLPGISLDGFLGIYPSEEFDFGFGTQAQYDEIIASEVFEIGTSNDLRLGLNVIYIPLVIDNDDVEFRILGRPDTNSTWQQLYLLETNSKQISNLEGLNLRKIDFDLDERYSDGNIQVGIQLKINDYELSNQGRYFVDSLRIYSRNEIVNQPPVVVNEPDSIALDQDFGEFVLSDINSYFNDPEGDSLSFNLVFSPGFIEATFSGNSLTLSSISGETGEGELVIRATDSAGGTVEVAIPLKVSSNTVVNTESVNGLPVEFTLQQNYPNPFNPSSNIRFGLPEASQVRLEVYNMLGQRVASLVDNRMPAGWHTVTFDAAGLSTGTYIYQIRAGSYTQTRKMMLIK